MKQLSSAQLNNLSKEDLAAMVLQMQKQINSLNEQISVMNARLFGRSTEKLKTLPGQICIFNETEAEASVVAAEPSIEQVVVRCKKQKGKRAEDLSRLPVRIENHELNEQELTDIFGTNGWKRLPDEVFSRVEFTPAVQEVVEHHVAVYAAKKNDDTMARAGRPADLLRNSIATPSLVAAIMNGKYTNAMPLYRIAKEFEQCDLNLSRAKWHVIDAIHGAQASAVVYSLVETAMENKLDPYRYLTWLLKTANTADLTDEQAVKRLLPWNAPGECAARRETQR